MVMASSMGKAILLFFEAVHLSICVLSDFTHFEGLLDDIFKGGH